MSARSKKAPAAASKPQLTLVQGAPAPLPAGVPQYLTVSEVAAMLRLTPKGIYKMVNEKRIPFRKAGAQLLFDPREIDEWTKPGAEKG
ncbi:MAG: helix-turn-helix domain-containing protein [Acidobacteria bacterium]|nr:helix-turn-helix domain-containing protein [Acidobacteriota bacterium]